MSSNPCPRRPPIRTLCSESLPITMSQFWSALVHDLSPYVPGEQPRMAGLVKLNTNELPVGPSPRVLAVIRAEATDTLRLYPDPQSLALRTALADYHGVSADQVFVGNGSD